MLQQYSRETYIHGIREIAEYKRFVKVLWVTVTILTLSYSTYEMYRVIHGFAYDNYLVIIKQEPISIPLFIGILNNPYDESDRYGLNILSENGISAAESAYLHGYSVENLAKQTEISPQDVRKEGEAYIANFSKVIDAIYNAMPEPVEYDEGWQISAATNAGNWDTLFWKVSTVVQNGWKFEFQHDQAVPLSKDKVTKEYFFIPGYQIKTPPIWRMPMALSLYSSNRSFHLSVTPLQSVLIQESRMLVSELVQKQGEPKYVLMSVSKVNHKMLSNCKQRYVYDSQGTCIRDEFNAELKLQGLADARRLDQGMSSDDQLYANEWDMGNPGFSIKTRKRKRSTLLNSLLPASYQNSVDPNIQIVTNLTAQNIAQQLISTMSADTQTEKYSAQESLLKARGSDITLQSVRSSCSQCHSCQMCVAHTIELTILEQAAAVNGSEIPFYEIIIFNPETSMIYYEQLRYTWASTVASLGGIAGLCSGLSIVSLWHTIFFAATSCRKLAKKTLEA